MAEISAREQVACWHYSPLGFGVLNGKYWGKVGNALKGSNVLASFLIK